MFGVPVRSRPDSPFATSGQRLVGGPHRILIVGGGAGGLELAAALCRRLGRAPNPLAEVVLVDASLTHVWKPSLHELAAGTLMPGHASHDYLHLALRHGFRFHPGRLEALDRSAREAWLEPMLDGEGRTLADRRAMAYDTLVIATGSQSDSFGTPGMERHACTVDTPGEAQRLHRRLLVECARGELSGTGPVRIAVVGGGATGVELAIELSEAVSRMAEYGARLKVLSHPARITVIDAAPDLLQALPQALVACVRQELSRRGITVRLGQRVVALHERAVILDGDDAVPTDLTIWAAGIRCAEVLSHLDGLATNRRGQLLVDDSLRTTRDPDVFALGDCSQRDPGSRWRPFPPTAQCARQQARFLAALLLEQRLAGKPLPPFLHEDRGALLSLGQEDGVAEVPVTPTRRRVLLEGPAARWAYEALQYRHASLLVGPVRAALATLGRWLAQRGRARIKLH